MESPNLLRRVVLPVANSDDARETCRAVLPAIAKGNGEVLAVYVVETNPGGVNKASPSALKEVGEQTLSIVETQCEEYWIPVQTEIRYGPTVREEVFDIARSKDASSVALVPRAGSRVERFLSGDNALSMITRNDVPVVVFPRESPLTDGGRNRQETMKSPINRRKEPPVNGIDQYICGRDCKDGTLCQRVVLIPFLSCYTHRPSPPRAQ